MKKINFFRRVMPILALLVLSVGSTWAVDYTATSPATVKFTDGTYGNKTYLDVANTQTNATISTGSIDVLTYSAYYICHTMKPAWYAIVSGTTSQESGGSYTFSTAAANGFLATASNANGNNGYGYMNVRSTNTYQRYLYITGCTNVAILYKSASSKTTQVDIEEVSSTGTYSKIGSTAGGTSTSVAILSHASTLDANKYYRITLKASGTSSCAIYQIRFTPGEVSTDPSISAEAVDIDADATSGAIAYTLTNDDGSSVSAEEVGNSGWLSNIQVDEANKKVTFEATANESTTNDRTATIRLTYGTLTKDVTVTQKKYVVDFATLPFSWEGGSKADFEKLNGVTAKGLGSDYAASNAPYLIKLDDTGDYIQFKTNSRIGIITIGVKMLGGSTASSIAVTGSADGTNWSNTLETLSISGSSNAVLELKTENALAENYRYVRLTFTKGSNVGVGPITIEEYVAPAPRTVTFDGSGKGTPAETSLTEASTAAGVTLPTVNDVTAGYQFLGWTATENGTTVDDGLTEGATYKPKKDVTLYAVYGKIDYVITNQVEGATVTIKKDGSAVTKANVGDVITLSASKDEYTVSAWDVKDASSNAVTVTDNQFTMPASNVTINATFAEAAKSNTLIYKATLTSNTAATVSGSIGGTATLSLQLDNSKYKFGGTRNFITITLPAGQTFNEGDVLNIHTDKAAEANNNTIALFASNDAKADANVLQSQANFTALGDNKIILNSDFENLNTLTIARTSTYNWNGYVDYVEVTRQPAILVDPTCSATATAYNPECKAAVEMSVTAENYVYLQWYSCDEDGSNATAIAGANTASYTYTSTAAEEGTTKYFYCAAVNPKATNKTAKSEVISVAVKLLPRYTITATLPDGGSYTVNAQNVDADHKSFEAIEGATITMTTTADGTHQLHSTPFVVKDEEDAKVSVSKSGDNYTFTMPAKAVTVTAQYVPTYSITAGSCEHGSVEASTSRTSKGSKVTVTPTAAEHYHVSAVYYVKEGEETHNEIEFADDVYSFYMVASNVTVYADFEEDDNVTITWSINGNTDRTSKVYVGEAIVFPSNVDDIEGKKFQGWVAEADKDYSNETTAPNYVTGETASEAKTFYAVFATAEGNFSTNYSKITTMASLTDGNYVIAYDYNAGTQIAMGNTINASNYISASALSLTDSKYANPDADYIWTIKEVSDGLYTFYNADAEKYAKATSDGVSLETEPYNFTITWDATNSCFRIQSTTNTSYYLHGYVSGTAYDFRSTTSGSGAKYHMHLYKNESTVSYSDYCTAIQVEPTLSFAEPTYYAIEGQEFATPELSNPQSVTVAYVSSETGVATVNQESGAVYIVAPGTTTITASFGGSKYYTAASASYTLVVVPATVSVTTNTLGYATFAPAYNVGLPTQDGISVYYIATKDETSVTTSDAYDVITEDYSLAAGTGVIIKAAANTEVVFPVNLTANAIDAESMGNLLVGVLEDTERNSTEHANAYLFSKGSNGVGFYQWLSGTLAAGKAYLDLGTAPRAPQFIRFIETGTTIATSIEDIFNDEAKAIKFLQDGVLYIRKGEHIYNANGQMIK